MKRPAILAVVLLVVQACGSSTSSGSVSPTIRASVASPSPGLASPTMTPSDPAVAATGTPSRTTWPAPASLPAAGRILFTIERDGESHLAYIDPAGFHLIPTANDNSFANAIWAPNDTIIFDSERAGPRHIFRMGVDGRKAVQLTSGDTAQDSAAVSPDGSLIAYGDVSSSENRDIGIHLSNIDGSKVRDLTPGGGPGVDGEDDAAFSPDGRWIAFQRVVNPDAHLAGLFIIRPDGTGLRRLTADTSGAGYARWSPDGQRILFSSGTSALWIVDVASGKSRQISDPTDPGLFTDANWSPDGRQIVYRHFTPGTPASIELVLANADGSHQSMLWVAPIGYGGNRPDWVR
jgi:Tol biopolymer transport system component